MSRAVVVVGVAMYALTLCAMRARADLASYLKRPEPAYRWEKRAEIKTAGGMVYDLHLVSQTWHGITWQHRLEIFRPDHIQYPHFCMLLNTGGNGGGDTSVGMMAARKSGTVFAILYNIPNQPLFGGREEDALIVYTWLKYLDTGDDTWPLHFPMAKAVLKAMDAIQAFTRSERQPPITSFLITGASKRGWTTWLCGASQDKRIKAIAPMVIDTLNVAAQGPHQLAAYGAFSSEIDDYTSAGIPAKLATPMGQRLLQLEDPYSYRDILTLPKLIILGTNDHYWAQDALNLYWDGLKGPKWVMYDPNSGHGLEDKQRVYNVLTAYANAIAGRKKWPMMHWGYGEMAGGGAKLTVSSDIAPVSGRMFHAEAPTQDFREAHWTSDPMTLAAAHGSGPAGHEWTGTRDAPATGYEATFGELTYEIGGRTFTLSTQIRILRAANGS